MGGKKKKKRGVKKSSPEERPRELGDEKKEEEEEFLPAVPPLMPMVSTMPVDNSLYGSYPAATSYTAPLMAPQYSYAGYGQPGFSASPGALPTYGQPMAMASPGYGMAAAPAFGGAPGYSYPGMVQYPASPGSVV